MARAADPRVTHAVRSYQAAQATLRGRVRAVVGHSWTTLGTYHRPDVATFAARTAPVVIGGQKVMSALTLAYLNQLRALAQPGAKPITIPAGDVTGPDLRSGLDPLEEWTRPGQTVWYQLAQGAALAVAVDAGLTRLTAMVDTDLQLAKTWTSRAYMERAGVTQYERIPDATACDYCLGAAESGPYHSANLMPIHAHCGCDVAPVFGGPAETVQTDALGAGPLADDAAKFAVETNSEIGPVLVDAGQNFRSAEDLVQQAAQNLVDAATKAEPELTALVSRLANEYGGTMEGLDFRLKSVESLARKIEADMVKENLTASEVAGKLFDVNRYTTTFNAADYARSAQAEIDALRAEGYTLKVKNYWNVKDNPYQGINVQVTDRAGRQFELQFHTSDSLGVKENELHAIYEKLRVTTDPELIRKYTEESFAIAKTIPVPSGVGSVH